MEHALIFGILCFMTLYIAKVRSTASTNSMTFGPPRTVVAASHDALMH